jgi:hypothetical protein
MYPHIKQQNPVQQTMRAGSADYFKMDVPRASLKANASDSKPLRRAWNPLQGMDVWESNQNMCTALWQLMERC